MTEEIWILDEEPIRVSFDTRGYSLHRGGRGLLGSPVEAQLRLVAVKGNEKFEVSSIPDLEGRVVIESSDEALEFARLFTSLDTHYLFPDARYIEPSATREVPGAGEYTEEYQWRMNLQPVRVDREGGHFVIERNLLDRDGRLFRATERVGRTGSYSLSRTSTVDEHSPINYPIYQ